MWLWYQRGLGKGEYNLFPTTVEILPYIITSRNHFHFTLWDICDWLSYFKLDTEASWNKLRILTAVSYSSVVIFQNGKWHRKSGKLDRKARSSIREGHGTILGQIYKKHVTSHILKQNERGSTATRHQSFSLQRFCGKLIDVVTEIIASKCAINRSLIPVFHWATSFFSELTKMKAQLAYPCKRA